MSTSSPLHLCYVLLSSPWILVQKCCGSQPIRYIYVAAFKATQHFLLQALQLCHSSTTDVVPQFDSSMAPKTKEIRMQVHKNISY